MLNIVNESEQLLQVISDVNEQKRKLEEELTLQKENTQRVLVDLDQQKSLVQASNINMNPIQLENKQLKAKVEKLGEYQKANLILLDKVKSLQSSLDQQQTLVNTLTEEN